MCPVCKEEIPISRRRKGGKPTIYCSTKCRFLAGRARTDKIREMSKTLGLPSNSVGAIGELRVVCDLITKGYEVFRPVSPIGKYDLIAVKGKKLMKVEVKTAMESPTGKLYNPTSIKDRVGYDVLALVSHKGTIKYQSRKRGKNRKEV